MVDTRLAQVHPVNQTPWVAVLCVGGTTAAAMFLGDAILVPISEVGSVASAAGWMAACAAYYRMRPAPGERATAAVGVVVGILLILMKLFPFVPGHFSAYEYVALVIWGLAGLVLNLRESVVARQARGAAPKEG